MLLESKGLTIDNFFIPPFSVGRGEVVTIYMFSGAHFFSLAEKLSDLFLGKVKHENVSYSEQFCFVNINQPIPSTEYIVFELVGQDLHKSLQTYQELMQHVKNGGAAIFLDNHNDDSLESTRHIEIQKLN